MTRPLTPRQEQLLAELIDLGGPRPSFGVDLAARLQGELDGEADAAMEAVGGPGSSRGPAWQAGTDRPVLVLGKHTLAALHRCERHFLAEEAEGFSWSPATAEGVVAHKAVELMVQSHRPLDPGDAVAMALDRVRDDRMGPAQWLDAADEAERVELTARATDAVTKFEDTFPPIPIQWRPRVESRLRAHVGGGRVELSGKVDLALGRASGAQARVLIVDLKTGRPAAGHAADLRFYALLETLRVGVPPFRLASLYLDSGHWRHEDVDEDLLWSTARRVGDALRALAGLRLGRRPPVESAGPTCAWCPVRADCPTGRRPASL